MPPCDDGTYRKVVLVGSTGTGKSMFVHHAQFGMHCPYVGEQTQGVEEHIFTGGDGRRYSVYDTGGGAQGQVLTHLFQDADLLVRFQRTDDNCNNERHGIYERELHAENRRRRAHQGERRIICLVVRDFTATGAEVTLLKTWIDDWLVAVGARVP